jgi:hypothetical protein
LAKAEERVAMKNLEFSEGNPCSTSLLSVNKDLALDCLQKIGFNLGEYSVEKDNNFYSLLEPDSGREVGEVGGFEHDWVDFDSEEESGENMENLLKEACVVI